MGWSDKVNQMARSAVSKSREMAEITRLNMDISNNEQKIKDLASKLGMLAIEQNLLSDNDQAAELIAQIRGCQATIEQDKATVQEIRNINICSSCGAEVSRTSKFCDKCGAPMSRDVLENSVASATPTCPQCGARLDAGAKFCTECGAKLSE